MNVTEGMVQTVFYRQLLLYGNSNYVAAMSIVYSVDQFIFMPIIGLCQGAQPIISYNYGAGNAERFHRVIRLLVGTAVIFAAAAVVIIECIPKSLVSIFTTDNNVITIGTRGLRIFVLGRLPISVQLALQELFRSIGYAKTTMYNAAVRKLVLIIPLALLLPALWGLGTDGVFLSECISDVLAAGNTVIVYLLLRKRII
jgi:Na+-driven multidrug efflux pump